MTSGSEKKTSEPIKYNDQATGDMWTALRGEKDEHQAILRIRDALKRHADPNSSYKAPSPALHYAAMHRTAAVFFALADSKDANLEIRDGTDYDYTLLMRVVVMAKTELFRYLLISKLRDNPEKVQAYHILHTALQGAVTRAHLISSPVGRPEVSKSFTPLK
jgi:hypothetical protein